MTPKTQDITATNAKYDAFISYSHSVDGKLAPCLQNALQKLAKPWYKARALRVYRDVTDLSASPHLWSDIENALKRSEYFILMASTQAARSKWVRREIEYWINNKPLENLIIVLTDGDILWSDENNDYDWDKTSALPKKFEHVFEMEPLYVDLKSVRSENDLSVNNISFVHNIAPIAAKIQKTSVRDLVGEDVRQHRKTIRTAWVAVSILIALSFIAGIAAYFASIQKAIAEKERDEALRTQSLFLADLAQQEIEKGHYANGVLLALEALPKSIAKPDRPYVPQAEAQLYTALLQLSEESVLAGHEGRVTHAAFSPDGHRVLTSSWDATARIWDAINGHLLVSLIGHKDRVTHAAFSYDGRLVVTASVDATARLWNASTGKQLAIL
ncbi:MAG: TIR domain-containing protein, partial [Planctomycetota bacterium]